MRVPDQGCVICNSTWGNYWVEVEGQRMFFCWEICAIQFQNLVDEVKRRTGWKTIEEVKIEGDYRGRVSGTLSRRSLLFLHRPVQLRGRYSDVQRTPMITGEKCPLGPGGQQEAHGRDSGKRAREGRERRSLLSPMRFQAFQRL